MKIILPVEKEQENTDICQSLGRTPYFMLYDTNTGSSEFFQNPASNSPSGAGIEAAQAIVDSGANTLLTPRCGNNAYSVLKKTGIAVFRTIPGPAISNIHAFLEGDLSELDTIHEGRHHGEN